MLWDTKGLARYDIAQGRNRIGCQIFMLLGTLLLLPFIIGFVVMIYWLFRGKVREGESDH